MAESGELQPTVNRVGGPARGYTWPPFEPANLAALKSGFWASPTLRADDRGEVEEIAASIRERMPCYSPAFEPAIEQLACRIWRQRRAYADLSEHGVVRDGKPAPVLVDLSKLENAIARDLSELGMTPASRMRMGLDVALARKALTIVEMHALAALEDEEAS
jgi:hypothetical protein